MMNCCPDNQNYLHYFRSKNVEEPEFLPFINYGVTELCTLATTNWLMFSIPPKNNNECPCMSKLFTIKTC